MSTNLTNALPSDWLPSNAAPSSRMPASRLCFQAAGSAVAWVSLGTADVLITWRACIHEAPQGGAGVPYFVITGLLFCLTLLAGGMSYRSWQEVSGITALLRAEGRERSEFLSLAGLFISFTLGAGMVWLGIPLFILEMCVRTR
jgi:hypothetical protein